MAAGIAVSSTLCLVAAPDAAESNERPFLFQEGPTDAQLVIQLKLAVPALGNTAMGDFEKICQVRQWLSHFIPGADASSGLDLPGKFKLDHFTATTAQMLAWCERREAGMQCGGASVLAYRVFRLLGYDSVVLNFGDDAAGVSHVTTLVKLAGPSDALWTMQDVSYNFTVLGASGQPLCFRQIVDLLANGRKSELHLQQPAGSLQVALYPSSIDPTQMPSMALYSPQLQQRYDGYASYYMRTDFRDNFARIGTLTSFLQNKVHDPDPVMIFLFPLGCSGERDAQILLDHARSNQIRLAADIQRRS